MAGEQERAVAAAVAGQEQVLEAASGEATGRRGSVFSPGAMVLVTLGAPREKFWGTLLELSAAGIALRGVDLNAFADFAAMVKSGEPATPETVFFPMHRVERVLLDEADGALPSLAEQFAEKSGLSAGEVFTAGGRRH